MNGSVFVVIKELDNLLSQLFKLNQLVVNRSTFFWKAAKLVIKNGLLGVPIAVIKNGLLGVPIASLSR